MDRERDYFIDKKETKMLVQRFEKMLQKKEQHFFDVIELECIVEHYLYEFKIKDAENAIDFALNLHPYSIELKIKKAQVLFSTGNYKLAHKMLIVLEKIENTNPDIFLLLGNIYIIFEEYDKAHTKFREAIKYSEEDIIEILLEIALNFEQVNKYDDALKYLTEAYVLDNSFLPIIYELAYCCEKTGKFEKSIRFYKIYLDQEPFSCDAWYNLGLVYNKIDDYNSAIDAYDYAIAIDNKFETVYFNKANSLANAEIYTEAIEVYHEYIKIAKESPEAFFYIAECYMRIDDFEMAEKYYSKTLKLDEKFSDALFGIGIINYFKDKYTESLLYLNKAIEIDNDNPEYWFYLGLVNSKLKFEKASASAFKKASELDPYDCDIWLSYAELHFENNKIDKAINIIKKAVSLNNNAKLNYRLAAYYFCNKNIGLAIDKFETGLSIDFDKHNEFLNLCPDANSNNEIIELIDKYKS